MRIVMLGTGTDVGKTYVTSCLARTLRSNVTVVALKPVESGVVEGATGDAGTIAKAAGHDPRLSPWRLRRPVSPHLAAREEGVALRLPELVRWVEEEERRANADVTLVETAGGALSPLASGATNADLAAALEPAIWILVARDALGVLHDVTATLRSLPRAPDVVLLSGARPPDPSTGSNGPELATLGICRVLEVIERGAEIAPGAAEWILRRLPQRLA